MEKANRERNESKYAMRELTGKFKQVVRENENLANKVKEQKRDTSIRETPDNIARREIDEIFPIDANKYINWEKYHKLGELVDKVGNRPVVELLKRKLVDERMPILKRKYIAEAIGKLSGQAELSFLKDIFVKEGLKEDFSSLKNSCTLCASLANIIGELGHREDISILERVRSHQEDLGFGNGNIDWAINKLKDKYEY